MRYLATLILAALWASSAWATVVCTGCEYDEGAAGGYLGSFNPFTSDTATFQHSGVGDTPFVDYWVFDIGPIAGHGSISVDFTANAPLQLFRGQLFEDNGSVCPGFACSSVTHGGLIAQAFDINRRWEILSELLQPGRYVLQISGASLPPRGGAYTGQIGFIPVSIREAGTLGLFGLGLIGIAVVQRKRARG